MSTPQGDTGYAGQPGYAGAAQPGYTGAEQARYAEETAYAGQRPDVGTASVGELISDVSRDFSTLMRQELELAKAELKEEATKTGAAAGMLGGAGFAGYMTLLFLSIALWWGLSNVMDQGWAALIVAALWAVIGGVLYASGRSRMRQVHPKPERTVETVKQVPDALKGR